MGDYSSRRVLMINSGVLCGAERRPTWFQSLAVLAVLQTHRGRAVDGAHLTHHLPQLRPTAAHTRWDSLAQNIQTIVKIVRTWKINK